jgi:hypothetical protein
MRHPDPWLEMIIEQEVSKRLRRLRDRAMFSLTLAGIATVVWVFGHTIWMAGYRAACG